MLIVSLVSEQVPRVQKGIINLAFVDDETMREYNKKYREKDSTTDVLSFHYFEDFSTCSVDEVVGEILFSESKILSQALEHGHDPKVEFQILLIHSLLHLLGFDHETDDEYAEMWEIEKKLRETCMEYKLKKS
jgi:probable rRNA maturation factor